ncbi:NAD(P)H-dependent glycerol-3-phosphate dehydrogenase [Moraxella oculi]|uniref:Glycerol-3-phosphate dehydrogenase [NAD(P)+] n=1 Tax=Moraxella oculi TaxID=2940516 RepID=A0ABW8U4H8_9GAMM
MKLTKPKKAQVKKIVDVASDGFDDAVHAIKGAGIESNSIFSNIVRLAGLRKKKVTPELLGVTVAEKSNETPLKLVFIGGGSFGTAMANMAAKNGCDATLWVRNKSAVKAMKKTKINKKYLPNHKLAEELKFSHDLESAVQGKDIIFVAVPSSAFREMLTQIKPYITHQAVVSLTKGMEKDTFAMMSDIIKEVLPQVNFGVMSGPNLAIEIMDNMPSATVIASPSEPLRTAVQEALHSAFFRVFASDDVKGVELGGTLKNIYAIAIGMVAAYDVGDNTKAMLLTRALAEMSRFGVAVGANPLTFLGLSGVGDLYATCNSVLSRNYRIGNMLGKGMSLDGAIKKLGQTAEGVNTILQVHERAQALGIYMPITHALHAILYEDKSPLGVALNLMEKGFRSDVEFVMPHDESNIWLSQEFDKALQASKKAKPKPTDGQDL